MLGRWRGVSLGVVILIYQRRIVNIFFRSFLPRFPLVPAGAACRPFPRLAFGALRLALLAGRCCRGRGGRGGRCHKRNLSDCGELSMPFLRIPQLF